MSAPIYSTARTFQGYVVQKTLQVPRETTETSHIIVLAPCNDVLGGIVKQAGPLSSATQCTLTPITDSMVTDLLSPVGTTFAINPLGSRYTEFCVEVTSTEALATTANLMYFTRWTQGQVPLASIFSGTLNVGAEFATMWNSTMESEPKPISMGELVKTHCFHTSMNDRGALEFSKFSVGQSTWASCYSANSGGTNSGVLWDPIVILIRGSTIPEYTLTVKGRLDVQPAMNTSWYRVSRVPSPPSPSQESNWWKRQRALGTSEVRPVYTAKSRDAAPYVGAGGDAQASTKALRGSKAKAPKKKPSPQDVAKSAALGSAAGVLAAAARVPLAVARARRRRRDELRR